MILIEYSTFKIIMRIRDLDRNRFWKEVLW